MKQKNILYLLFTDVPPAEEEEACKHLSRDRAYLKGTLILSSG